MAILAAPVDTTSAEFRANANEMRALIADLERRRAEAALGGPERARERHTARGKLLPRERVLRLIDPGTPFLELVAARRERHVRGRDPWRRPDRRHRPRRGPRMRHHRQRRHHQRRHLLPDDGEEASARPGDRVREPAAVHLSRRFRRRQPAAPDRRVSRPRPLRPHLLQPGQSLGGGHRPDRGRDGLVHGGRRLRAGDVRRDDHRARAGHDLSRRPAAGEGRDRGGGERGRPWRRRRPCAALRRRRPYGRRRQSCARRSAGASSRTSAAASA